MSGTLTRPFDAAKKMAIGSPAIAGDGASRGVIAADGDEWVGSGAQRRRRPKTPEMLLVPHAALRHPGLNRTAAIALAALVYRRRHGVELDAHTLSAWCGWSRWTSQRALRTLAKLDLIGEDGALRPERFDGPAGAVRVVLSELREHGPADALALAQLRSWRELGMAKVNGAWFEVTAQLLARFLGACERTARRVLERLGTGRTVKVQSVVRKGVRIVFCGLVELKRKVGHAAFVRFFGARDVAAQRSAAAASAKVESAKVDSKAVVATPYQDEGLEYLGLIKSGAYSPSRSTR